MPACILIFLFGDLGDAILTVPAIRALRQKFPRARLVLLAKSGAGEFVQALDLVDEVVAVDKHAFDGVSSLLRPTAFAAVIRLAWSLRRRRPDVVVLFHHLVTRWGTLKFALLSLATGAPQRVGLDNGRGWFLTHRAPDRGFGNRHESEYWLEVASLLGATGDLQLAAPISAGNELVARRMLKGRLETGLPLVAIHPGTGWYGPGRQWPAAKFAETARIILGQRLVTYVVVGSSQDEVAARTLLACLPSETVDLVGKTDVGQLAAVLARCSLLLANDSGVGHLASAVGIPVISVFGPSNEKAWRPLTATVIASDLPCRPCFYRDFERGLPAGCASRECLELVTPASVARAVLRVLPDDALAG